MTLVTQIARGAGRALDIILPPRCLGCGIDVGHAGSMCAPCWSKLRFIERPWCRLCGRPLPEPGVPDALCGRCAFEPPAYDRARAALHYGEASRMLVLGLKRGARFEGLPSFATWLARAGEDLLEAADLFVPVPLHRWRLVGRGFNQSGLLASALSRATGIGWSANAMRRSRRTRSQQGLSGEERLRNIGASAFEVPPRHRHEVEGARVILIDDVLTTGATLAACTTILRDAGAANVDVLTLARVVSPEAVSI